MARLVLIAGLCAAQLALAGCSTVFNGVRQGVSVAVRPDAGAEVRVYALTTGELVAGPVAVPATLALRRGEAASAPKLVVPTRVKSSTTPQE